MQIPDGILDVPRNLSIYMGNLCRLQLIEIPVDVHYIDEDVYSSLENVEYYYSTPKEKLTFERKIVRFTEFGYYFLEICM